MAKRRRKNVIKSLVGRKKKESVEEIKQCSLISKNILISSMKMTQDNEVKRMKCGIVKFKELGSNSNGVCAPFGFVKDFWEVIKKNFIKISLE
jgi:hypothetical protein